LQRAAVQDHGGRLLLTPGEFPQQHAQVLDHDLEALGSNPPLRLLVNDPPRWQIMRYHPPLDSGPHYVSHSIEHLPKTVLPLLRIFAAQRQVRRHECPLLVANITRIAASTRHESILREMDFAPPTFDSTGTNLITGSKGTEGARWLPRVFSHSLALS
jgi:hypothetical protein